MIVFSFLRELAVSFFDNSKPKFSHIFRTQPVTGQNSKEKLKEYWNVISIKIFKMLCGEGK